MKRVSCSQLMVIPAIRPEIHDNGRREVMVENGATLAIIDQRILDEKQECKLSIDSAKLRYQG